MVHLRWSRAIVSALMVVQLFALDVAAQAHRLPRVGVLWFTDAPATEPINTAFREGMRQLGYIDGRNVEIITRYANASPDRIPPLISELVALRADVLYISSRALGAAKERAGKVPVVCAGFTDPVAEGFAASLSRPGGNFTGLSWRSPEIAAKRLSLAREIIPAVRTVGLLHDPDDPQSMIELETYKSAAAAAGLDVRLVTLQSFIKDGLPPDTASARRPQVLFVSDAPLATQHRETIGRRAIANRIPLFAETHLLAESGALIAYGADGIDMFRRGAAYVDKILKGARAADLPIEQPTKFLLVVNTRTATTLGTSIPDVILLRADTVLR